MRRTDGGFRPSVNVQVGACAQSGARAKCARMRVERVIGSMKRRGLSRAPLFGLAGAGRWARWHALAHNLLLGVRG